jgi:FixJ family two-component response regulator
MRKSIARSEEERIVVVSPAKPIVAVIDDDYRVLESLEDMLESAGYRVRLFASAKQFLDTAIADVDCVISDIGMSNTDGFELQHLVRISRPKLPVILITGRHEFATPQHQAARGGRLLFEKPFDTRELLAAIGSELQTSSGRP